MTENVRECFEETLNATHLDSDDSFFILGGTSFSAIKLTYLLWKSFSVEISFSILVQHPTVRKLSAFIISQHQENSITNQPGLPKDQPSKSNVDSPVGPRLSENVKIVCLQEKVQPEQPNLFLVHPAFWSSVSYLEISKQFAGFCGVYGIEGNPGPHSTSMESLATTYISAMLEIQPSGPYCIISHKISGIIW